MDIQESYKTNAAALLKDPDDAVSLVNQFVLLAGNSKRSPSHLALTARAVAIAPQSFEAVFNHASALNRAGCYLESFAGFMRASLLAPKERKPDVYYNLGMCRHDLGDLDGALKWYDQSLALKEDREVRQAHAVARLAKGELGAGLYDHEIEHWKPSGKAIADSGVPRWRGESLNGRTLIVAHEQGFGDTLQFCRVIPRLRYMAQRLIWSGPPVLNSLIGEQFQFDDVTDENPPFGADFYCSPMSAMGALRLSYGDISNEPYMRTEALKLPSRARLRVGLAWAGSPSYARDDGRSMRLEDLCPLFDLPGAAFYSLQMRPVPKEIHQLGLDGLVGNLGTLIKDWKDTARAIEAMDVVVSVDTANAHLAGALGKPVLLMLPYAACWRWLRHRSDTYWYKHHRLFRQFAPGNWDGPIAAVREVLKTMLEAPKVKAEGLALV